MLNPRHKRNIFPMLLSEKWPLFAANRRQAVKTHGNFRKALSLARIFHKLAGFFTSGTVLEEKSGWTALVFRFRRNLILIVL